MTFRFPSCGWRTLLLFAIIGSMPAWAKPQDFAIVGDSGMLKGPVKLARESIHRLGVKRLILPGDNLYVGDDYEAVWGPWKKLGLLLDIVAIGNHTLGYAQETRYFGMPGEYYSTVRDGIRFIVLNSDNVKTADKQARWFDAQMTSAREALVFVVFHHPPYTISPTHAWTEKKAFHEALRPLFQKHRSRISALIVGHDHISSLVTMGGLPMIVAGAAGEQRDSSPVSYTENGVEVKTAWLYGNEPSWGRLTADPEKKRTHVDFIDSASDRVLCSATLAKGRLSLADSCRKPKDKVN